MLSLASRINLTRVLQRWPSKQRPALTPAQLLNFIELS
jgi:hypothetical protein